MALTSKVSVQFSGLLTGPLDLATPTMDLLRTLAIELASGTGANQADMIWSDRRTLAASGTEDLDLAGVLTHPLTGALLTFARLKAILIYAATTNTNNVNLTRPAAAGVTLFLAASDGVAVRPGGLFVVAAPDATAYVVTATTADLLTVTNSAAGTEVIYDVILIGASA